MYVLLQNTTLMPPMYSLLYCSYRTLLLTRVYLHLQGIIFYPMSSTHFYLVIIYIFDDIHSLNIIKCLDHAVKYHF